MREKSEMRKAAVFPVPVCACAAMSSPRMRAREHRFLHRRAHGEIRRVSMPCLHFVGKIKFTEVHTSPIMVEDIYVNDI